jgi:hypothetical protein
MNNTMSTNKEKAPKTNLTLQELADKNGHKIPEEQNTKFWASVKRVLKELEAAQDKIERYTRGLDKVEPESDEENELNHNIREQYDMWVTTMASAEGMLDGLEGADAGVYWQRVAVRKVTVQKTMTKANEHFDQRHEGEDLNWDNKGTTLNTYNNEYEESNGEEDEEEEDSESSEDLQPVRRQCSTPFVKKKSKQQRATGKNSEGYGVSFKNVGLDTFISGLNTGRSKGKKGGSNKDTNDANNGGGEEGAGIGGGGGSGSGNGNNNGNNNGSGNGNGNGNGNDGDNGGSRSNGGSSGTMGKKYKYMGSMKTQASNRWLEQSFLDQDTLLDNLTARASKKVSWNDFFSKRHSRRYYCPNEKQVSGDYTHGPQVHLLGEEPIRLEPSQKDHNDHDP